MGVACPLLEGVYKPLEFNTNVRGPGLRLLLEFFWDKSYSLTPQLLFLTPVLVFLTPFLTPVLVFLTPFLTPVLVFLTPFLTPVLVFFTRKGAFPTPSAFLGKYVLN